MAHNRRLETDQDFQEAMDRGVNIRIFQDDHVVGSGGIIVRYDEKMVVIQSGVGDVGYFERNRCEFFGMRKG